MYLRMRIEYRNSTELTSSADNVILPLALAAFQSVLVSCEQTHYISPALVEPNFMNFRGACMRDPTSILPLGIDFA
jgi:hypothetical protein